MSSSIRSFLIAALLSCLPAWTAHANSVGFSSSTYAPDNGQLIVTVVYDYSDFAMAGGGFDLLYDPESLEFVSYTAAPRQPDVMWTYGGTVDEPGIVYGIGHSTKFFNGITSSGEFGTIVFNVLSTPVGDPGCDGFQLCLVPTIFNPFVTLSGNLVTDEILADAYAQVVTVPAPAAFWLLAGGLVGLLRRRSMMPVPEHGKSLYSSNRTTAPRRCSASTRVCAAAASSIA